MQLEFDFMRDEMPIVKKREGWFWGGQGPFTTRKEASEVAQAAYASGFKKKETVEPKKKKSKMRRKHKRR